MKSTLLLCAILAVSFPHLSVNGFVVPMVQHGNTAIQRLPSSPEKSMLVSRNAPSSLTRQFLSAADEDEDDDDEEDDDDDQKGPLSNGVDSVSWLPSVVGAKGDNMPITTAKEVSHDEIYGANWRVCKNACSVLTHFFFSLPIRMPRFFHSFLLVVSFILPIQSMF